MGILKMYYLESVTTNTKIPIPMEWIPGFENIKWNENEEIMFQGKTITKIKTLPGNFQGIRYWFYETFSGTKLIDCGEVKEYKL